MKSFQIKQEVDKLYLINLFSYTREPTYRLHCVQLELVQAVCRVKFAKRIPHAEGPIKQ